MSSAETDRRDRAERNRMTDRDLAADRQGRDRLRARADQQVEPSHRPSKNLPNSDGGR